MALYRDQGIVLRTYKLGEADRIVSFMTERHGKVRAVAKGVRKTKSKFGARLEPPTHVALQLYEGRELDIVTQAESIDHFRAIREDLDRLTRAVTMLEAVDQLSLEREPNPELYKMLVGGLKAIADRNSALLVAGFHWKLLALEGFSPAQEGRRSGGPRDPALLWTGAEARRLFAGLELLECLEGTVRLDEGPRHQGEAEVVRGLWRRPG